MGPYGCLCYPGYYWNGTNCSLNCSSLTTSNGTNTSNNTCFCKTGYFWDFSTCSIDCSLVRAAISRVNVTTCVCLDGYNWNGTKCVMNCSAMPGGVGAAPNGTSCTCKAFYYWNGIICQAVCGQFAHTTGSYVATYAFCECVGGYVWTESGCAINCNFLYLPNVIGNDGNDACQCLAGYYWTLSAGCVLNCSNMTYSTGISTSNVTC